MYHLQVVLRYVCDLVSKTFVSCIPRQLDPSSFSRLPVRALLFHCSICSHGGHQACYRSYYAQRQMIDLPRSSVPPPAISSGAPGLTSRTGSGSTDEESGSTTSTFNSSTFDSSADNSFNHGSQGRFIGRPCAAGCGHFCWIANAILES